MSRVEGSHEHERLIASDNFTLSLQAQAGRWESSIGFVIGVALTACGLLALASAVVGGLSDGRDTGTFALLAVVYSVAGATLIHVCRVPVRLRSSTAFIGVLAVWLVLILVSTSTYQLLGIFAHVDDSIFESVAGFTTTASTVVRDPESLSRATLLWRAGTQWLGGLAALLFVVAVLPSIGVGGLDVTEAGQRHAGTSLRSRWTILALQRLTSLYVGLTVVGVGLFFVAGMGTFDAITYAATTISTGGFANHAGSFGHFRSATVEWAGFGGMVLGGANMALLVRMLRGGPAPLWRSYELRAYLAVIAVGGGVIAMITAPDGGPTDESVRRAYFHVASAASTTGHFVQGWGNWDVGPQVLLLAIMGVGAMSGSAGSGFRMVRALAMVGYLRRELIQQLHPRAVLPVRVGRRAVSDALVSRMVGYQAQYFLVAAIGAIAVGALGGELVTSLSAAISAVANVGPALGDMVPGGGGVLVLARPARATLMPLMLLGRLEIAPVLVGVMLAGSALGDRLRANAHDRHQDVAARRSR